MKTLRQKHAVRTHVHYGAEELHPVTIRHYDADTRKAHKAEIKQYTGLSGTERSSINKRRKVRTQIGQTWDKSAHSLEDLTLLHPKGKMRPSTMDRGTHKQFLKIMDAVAQKHREKYGIKNPKLVRNGFHTVHMSEIWRRFKQTHAQDYPRGPWRKRKPGEEE